MNSSSNVNTEGKGKGSSKGKRPVKGKVKEAERVEKIQTILNKTKDKKGVRQYSLI